MTALHFRIDASQPASRTARVTVEFPRDALAPHQAGESGYDETVSTTGELFLASWTPGSYLLREYARHLSRVEAVDADTEEPLRCLKTAKNRFAIELGPDTLRVRVSYRVYAHELTVRTSDFTDTHAYWNHATLLLWPVGRPELPATLQVAMPVGWDAACGLPVSARHAGEVTWEAASLDQAIDSPCLLGTFERIEFTVQGVPHEALLEGLEGVEPPATLAKDLSAIVAAAAEVFGGELPYSSYQFQCLLTDDGYGGLEHRNSTTLLCRRTAFANPKTYREFLALCAHELFHAWNVKRMRPKELWNFDYERENYTQFLWLAEGWTAYYDDLLCLRAGHMTATQYLDKVVAKNITRLLSGAGRFELSLGESSHDAWIRLYRPDENTRNSSQNYYVNGAVAAMCLDLTVRRASNGAHNLDDVLRNLYAATYEADRGYEMGDVEAAVREAGGEDSVQLLRNLVLGPLDPPLGELLAHFGVTLEFDALDRPFLGVAFKPNTTRIASVQGGTPADREGLHPDDEILALNSLRVTSETWRSTFDSVAHIQEPLEILLARRGAIRTLSVVPTGNPTSVKLRLDPKATPDQEARLAAWLRSP